MLTDIPAPMVVWKNMAVGVEFETVDAQLADYFGVKHGLLVRSVDMVRQRKLQESALVTL